MRNRRAVQRRAALREDRRRQRRRRSVRRLFAALVVLAAVILPSIATAQDTPAEPAPTEPKYSWGSWTWSQTLVKPGADRHVLFGARYAATLRLPYGVNLNGRADASALQDGAAVDAPLTVDITDPRTFQTLELYAGLERAVPKVAGLSAVAFYGFCLDIEGGRLKAVERYPRAWGVGIRMRDLGVKGSAVSFYFGEHEASGSGYRFLATGQIPIDGRFSLVGDGALGEGEFGRAGAFGRGGLAVRLGGSK